MLHCILLVLYLLIVVCFFCILASHTSHKSFCMHNIWFIFCLLFLFLVWPIAFVIGFVQNQNHLLNTHQSKMHVFVYYTQRNLNANSRGSSQDIRDHSPERSLRKQRFVPSLPAVCIACTLSLSFLNQSINIVLVPCTLLCIRNQFLVSSFIVGYVSKFPNYSIHSL